MDQDDFDQYRPRRANDASTTDATKLHNLTEMRKTGLEFSESEGGDVLIFRSHGRETVEFLTRRSRWRVRGKPGKTHFGTVGQFVTWLRQLRGCQA